MKVFFDMVGCRLNQAEIDKMSLDFQTAGHTVVNKAALADMIVVNTCSVTTQAASDSRQKIRHYSSLGGKEVISTGCWTTLEPTAASQLGSGIRVIQNHQKDTLVRDILSNSKITAADPTSLEPFDRVTMPGLRQRTRSFIKVQDGCDNLCTFCITRVARGKGVSRPTDEILSEIHNLTANGSKEIILTGVHLGSWGQDLQTEKHLYDLLRAILEETNVPRIRLSSLEPWDLSERFFSLWEDPRMCAHIHLPLQAGCDATLRRMLRKTTTASFRALVSTARAMIPNLSITTDIITGFPGESDAEFQQTSEFVQEMAFSGGHVFSYSEREGTAATKIRERVPNEVRKQRNAMLQQIIKHSADAFERSQVGTIGKVIWEASPTRTETGWIMSGYTSNYVRVHAASAEVRWNQIDDVELLSFDGESLQGRIIKLLSDL